MTGMRLYIGILIIGLTFGEIGAQDLRMNELMSSNVSILPDEDGEYVDWIELYNGSDSTIDLNGFGLSDDIANLYRWIFPEVFISPGQYLLVFCSGKDRFPTGDHYETTIREGDTWKYRLGDSEPPASWKELDFDDSGWLSGPTGIGYGDEDDATIIDQTLSLYIRRKFHIENTSDIISGILNIDYDDAYVAYLNGIEIARERVGIEGTPPPYDATGDSHEARMYRDYPPDQVDIDLSPIIEGENVLAIQVHNAELESSDMTIIPFLTFLMINPPANARGPSPVLNFQNTNFHTNFKLGGSGESVFLADTNGNIVDSITFGQFAADISYGRALDEPGDWVYFEEVTPGEENASTGINDIVTEAITFFPTAGFFEGTKDVYLSHSATDGVIRYTTDGSEPTVSSSLYDDKITFQTSTVIRARIFRDGSLPGKVSTQSYIDRDDIDADNLAIVSISTDPDYLYDDQEGLFLNAENRELEKPVHVELIEPNGDVGFSIDAGLKIFGNEPSGGYHQHKLSLFARAKYGYSSFEYQIFRDKPIEEYESVVLRNPIHDLRDVLSSTLIDDAKVGRQAFRPTIVFINGEYWGTKYLREKLNEHYVAGNYGVDPDSVDFLMGIESPVEYYNEEWPIAGDLELYKELVHYLLDHDLSDSANYEYIKTQIDIENIITYWASEIYFSNIDWPGNNTKFWRERHDQGIWRWILFDVDVGFARWESYTYNSLEQATEPDGPDQWPNPPWSTFIIRMLLENQSFRDDFVVRSLDLLNTDFTAERVNKNLDEIVEEVEGEVRNHFRRWDGSYREWEDDLEEIRDFADHRVPHVRNHIRSYFDQGLTRTVKFDLSTPGAGTIGLNTVHLQDFPWDGQYFKDMEMNFEAIPSYGYKFAGWEGIDGQEMSITHLLDESLDLVANFEREEWFVPIVINEINYNSSPWFDTEDWLELYNNSEDPVDLSNWVIRDSEPAHGYVIPVNTILQAGEYLVVCRDILVFHSFFPDVGNVIGNMGFGLNARGEVVKLFTSDGVLIDSVEYDDFNPWPQEPDGEGPTLSLNNPDFDNLIADNWHASVYHGTPGETNIWATFQEEVIVQNIRELPDPFPNPFTHFTEIPYTLEKVGHVNIAVYDLQGKLVNIILDEMSHPGTFYAKWTPDSVRPGIYICVIQTDTYIESRKLIYVKNQ